MRKEMFINQANDSSRKRHLRDNGLSTFDLRSPEDPMLVDGVSIIVELAIFFKLMPPPLGDVIGADQVTILHLGYKLATRIHEAFNSF